MTVASDTFVGSDGSKRETHAGAAGAGRASEPTPLQRKSFAVENMNCGGCMRKIERALEPADGVTYVRANLSAKRVSVGFDASKTNAEELIELLARNGFRAAELVSDDPAERAKSDRELLKCLAVAGFATANVMLLSVSVWSGSASDMDHELKTLFHWLSALIAIPAVGYAGRPFFRSAITAIRARRLNMDVPISLGLILACGMSLFQTIKGTNQVYFDASVSLCFFLLIGRYLDQSLRSHARGAAQNLLGLKATWARIIRADGQSERVAAQSLNVDDRILVAAGERIPADGEILSGESDIDEQLITGETVPKSARHGTAVYAGTVSLTAPLEIRVTAVEDDTLLAEIARLMEAAEQNKGLYVRLADRASQLYAPVVHALGLLTFLGWWWVGVGWEPALVTAIAVLIITCPCALALAVPAVQVAACSRLFKSGIIMTAADGLERLAEGDTLVLDKTGTLTKGEPALLGADTYPDEMLRSVAGIASASHHPYARAIIAAAESRGLQIHPLSGVVEKPGRGLQLETEDGWVRLGSAEWCLTSNLEGADEASLWYRTGSGPAPEKLEDLGPAHPGEATGFRFQDCVRVDAAEVVAEARQMGFDVLLISGDRPQAVSEAARAAGITEWYGGQKPAEKLQHLSRLEGEGRKVIMVGDGLNDAPALAAAHASLSMAASVDVSQMASDGIIQGQRLAPLIETLKVARRAKAMSLQNFGIAAIYNAICIPLAVAGFVTPLIAAVAMSASSIVVTANAFRLSAGARPVVD